MGIVVVGSISFDTIKTPWGHRDRSLGGAANYFALSAQFFSPVKMLGIVGQDFPDSHFKLLEEKNIDIRGISKTIGQSFHWQGEYGADLSNPKTLKTELNVFEHFMPQVPDSYKNANTVFLGNIDPDLQIHVLKQMSRPKIRALDTMNFWIDRKKSELKQAISMIDILFINDSEIRLLSGEHNIIKAARSAIKLGAKIIVIKRGEYGSLLFADNQIAFIPAYPVENVFDPTGAGDTFAGGFLGYLNNQNSLNFNILKKAMIIGTIMSSYVIEKFSFDRMLELDHNLISSRQDELLRLARLEF